jgi:hypothetical protein
MANHTRETQHMQHTQKKALCTTTTTHSLTHPQTHTHTHTLVFEKRAARKILLYRKDVDVDNNVFKARRSNAWMRHV